eukprot:CAMPEP_0185563918 /NCGR_PEP_ID=MMETSP1381-20130426/64450_1 /TAXON_ID=298111 /ORGANISM="Pavlova sp., Strain CCMP459" /LENGTH=57 /DNA_ID=CAMNT_0028177833 /DNA_START=114 /DNA_END=283 /DNA_ORIENTATION=-
MAARLRAPCAPRSSAVALFERSGRSASVRHQADDPDRGSELKAKHGQGGSVPTTTHR